MSWFIAFNILIIAIVIIRAVVDGWISRKMQYAMWLLLPIFLVGYGISQIPMSFNKTVENYVPVTVGASSIDSETYEMLVGKSSEENIPNEIASDDTIAEGSQVDTNTPISSTKKSVSQKHVLSYQECMTYAGYVWFAGAILMAAFLVVNNVAFAKRTRTHREFYARAPYGGLKVYKLHGISSPFLLGHNIYVSDDLDKESMDYKYAVCHECCHYSIGDNFWVVVKYIVMTMFWFDPLVWMAAILVQRDNEMAVDERVIKLLGEENKAEYGEMLINFVAKMSGLSGRMTVSTSMSGRNKSFIKTRILNIMRKSRKSVAVTLVVTILLTVGVGSFLFNGRAVKGVTILGEDSLWYDNNVMTFGDGSYNYYVTFVSKDYVVFRASQINQSGNYDCQLVCYSMDGTLIGAINENDVIYSNAFQIGDEFVAYGKTGNNWKLYTLDFANGEAVEKSKAFADVSVMISALGQSVVFDDRIYTFFDCYGSRDSREGFLVTDMAGNVINEIFVDSQCVNWSLDSEGNVLFEMDGEFWSADGQTGEIMEMNFSEDMLGMYYNYMLYGEYVYHYDQRGFISRYNLKTHEEEAVYDRNCSYLNCALFLNYYLVYADGDTLILQRMGGCTGDEDLFGREMIILTKSQNNPNAGKTIIEAAQLGFDTDIDCYAVSAFNRNNADYYIQVSYEYNAYLLEQDSVDIVDKLVEDIKNGSGPDILLNANENACFLSEDVALNLNDYIDGKQGVNREEYFDCAFTPLQVEGAQYVMPLEIQMFGMLVDSACLNSDKNGFTYDEYRCFAESYGSYNYWGTKGDAAIPAARNSLVDYAANGKLDVDNDDFRNMIVNSSEFYTLSRSDEYSKGMDMVNLNFVLCERYGHRYSDWRLCGVPSRYGTGPVMGITSSIAITSCADSPDVCWDFIKMALCTEVQSTSDAVPINIEGFENVGEEAVVYANSYIKKTRRIDNYYDDSVIEVMKGWMSEIDSCYYFDPIAEKVINEELRSYFEGQKSLDEAIKSINSRVEKQHQEHGW